MGYFFIDIDVDCADSMYCPNGCGYVDIMTGKTWNSFIGQFVNSLGEEVIGKGANRYFSPLRVSPY